MIVRFKIQYFTNWGESLRLSGSIPELGNWDIDSGVSMSYSKGNWHAELVVPDSQVGTFEYKYALMREGSAEPIWEWGPNRRVESIGDSFELIVRDDSWQAAEVVENALFSSAFTEVLMKRKPNGKGTYADVAGKARSVFEFQVFAPQVPAEKSLCLVGDIPELGNWDPAHAIPLSGNDFPLWRAQVVLDNPGEIAYKYLVKDKQTGEIDAWEGGGNRKLAAPIASRQRRKYVRSDGMFRVADSNWKGAGVAIPVFSLRSEIGMGVGEFGDIKLLTDWAEQTGMKMIQILPVNDTVATHSWKDSYPYAGISVFALHPMFMNLDDLGAYYGKKLQKKYRDKRTKLNQLEEVDYEAVMETKSGYFKELFDKVSQEFLADPAFHTFYEENKEWLLPYAVFSFLRDKNGTAAFGEWPELGVFDWELAGQMAEPGSKEYADIAIHYFIQFHLDRQLMDAAGYARTRGVVIQGDIPIGIYRNSVDAWVAPHLYNMESQAGAPPDAYAVAGQNWRFPTYNWHEMTKDGFSWWKWRLTHMARYFDAYRIDHILGFFRIWEIPMDAVQGLMGHFNPALALHLHELEARGLQFDYDRFCRPYIRDHFLTERFGELTEWVKTTFLTEYESGHYQLQPPFGSQRAIADFLETYEMEAVTKENVKEGLFSLVSEVLFLEAPFSDGEAFHPRIALQFTQSYKDLDAHTQHLLNEIYTDFFYHRQEAFWREEAMAKLPTIVKATDMLVIGEDLGMVPDCVPGVMKELGLLSLEIQRMPKDPNNEFVHPASVPYLSVASPSCHDMSTIRGWWEEDREKTNRYFHHLMGKNGEMPFFCEPWVAKEINVQHLKGNSMWVVFPLQDLLAMDPHLRKEDPHTERINVPSNPEHYWRYRMHLSMEQLLSAQDFNEELDSLVKESGR